MLELRIDVPKEEAISHLRILFEGFSDGTSGWDMEDYKPAWDFLQKIDDAVESCPNSP